MYFKRKVNNLSLEFKGRSPKKYFHEFLTPNILKGRISKEKF